MGIISGTFVSEWACGREIRTPAFFFTETGYCSAEMTEEDIEEDLINLEREYFEMPDGDELEICQDCHEYALRTVMVDAPGSTTTLIETSECPNSDCPSR